MFNRLAGTVSNIKSYPFIQSLFQPTCIQKGAYILYVCRGHFIFSVATVGFEQTMYTVMEGDGSVEICIRVSERVEIPFLFGTNDETAGNLHIRMYKPKH